jgi:hypothetical protein
MASYCANRSELFLIALFLGGAVSAIAFQYHGDDISKYFDIRVLHGYLNFFLVLTYLLPPLIFYSGLYPLNAVLVRFLGKTQLHEQRKQILRKLTAAALSKQVVDVDPADLIEEVAWTSLKKYWRPE